MKIDKFGKMSRQGAAFGVATRLLINGRIDGPGGTRVRKLPGYSNAISTLAISGGGSVVMARPFVVGDPATGEERIYLISGDKLYYFNALANLWAEETWRGEISADFNSVSTVRDRGTTLISGGADGVPAQLMSIDRQASENNGYFNDAEEFNADWFGPEELPKFITADHVAGTISLRSQLQKDPAPDYIESFGLSRDTMTYLCGQFLYEGGQVSIPSSDGVIPIVAPPDDEDTFFGMTRLCIPADAFDKRLVAVDIYASELQEAGTFSELIFPANWDGGLSAATRLLADEQFASLQWRWLTTVPINKPHMIYQGIGQLRSFTSKLFSFETPETPTSNDVLRQHFEDGIFGTTDAFYLDIRPLDRSSDWVTLEIMNNHSVADLVLGVERMMINVVDYGSSGITVANESDKYELRIYTKWMERPEVFYRGYIQINDYSDLALATVTIGSTVLTEGTHWHRGSTNSSAAASLASAITSFVSLATARSSTSALGTAPCVVEILSSAERSLGVNREPDMVASGTMLVGGKTGSYWTIDVFVRRPPSEAQELGDYMTVAQPYRLIEEYHPAYEFAVQQNRRVFKIDCTTYKRFRNMLMWSEIDMPSTFPNGNYLLLNTYPGERSRGLVAVGGALVALYERTAHMVRMTGEPIQYDEEEGVSEDGALSHLGIIDLTDMAMWPSHSGIKVFTSGIQDITEAWCMDDYLAVIASEFDNAGSYEGICGGFSVRQNIAIWSFPNSTYAIDGETIKMIAWDRRNNSIMFMSSDVTYVAFESDFSGGLLGVTATGMKHVLSADPTEELKMTWLSGDVEIEEGCVNTTQVRLRYLGTATLSVVSEGDQCVNETLDAHSSVLLSRRNTVSLGDATNFKVESQEDNNDFELVSVEVGVQGVIA